VQVLEPSRQAFSLVRVSRVLQRRFERRQRSAFPARRRVQLAEMFEYDRIIRKTRGCLFSCDSATSNRRR
jgi:hypothetical protein